MYFAKNPRRKQISCIPQRPTEYISIWNESEASSPLRYSAWVQVISVLHQCHPDSTLGEQSSNQFHHLRMEMDSHNQRYKSYGGTPCTVSMATGPVWGVDSDGGKGMIVGSDIGCWWFGAAAQLSWLLGFPYTFIWCRLIRSVTQKGS